MESEAFISSENSCISTSRRTRAGWLIGLVVLFKRVLDFRLSSLIEARSARAGSYRDSLSGYKESQKANKQI